MPVVKVSGFDTLSYSGSQFAQPNLPYFAPKYSRSLPTIQNNQDGDTHHVPGAFQWPADPAARLSAGA